METATRKTTNGRIWGIDCWWHKFFRKAPREGPLERPEFDRATVYPQDELNQSQVDQELSVSKYTQVGLRFLVGDVRHAGWLSRAVLRIKTVWHATSTCCGDPSRGHRSMNTAVSSNNT